MSKTIEEAMLRAWQRYRYGADHEFDPNDPVKPSENFEKGFEAAFALPLADRLTDTEKAMIKTMYNEDLGMAQHFHAKAKQSISHSCRTHFYGLREPYISRMKMLESIFGKEMFQTENK